MFSFYSKIEKYMHTLWSVRPKLPGCTVPQTFQFVQECVRKLKSLRYKCVQVLMVSTIKTLYEYIFIYSVTP